MVAPAIFVAGVLQRSPHSPRQAARVDEDTLPVWGQGLGPAAELPLGAELYVRSGSAGDLLSPVFFKGVIRHTATSRA